MTEFSRRVDVTVFKDQPKTREMFVEWTAVDGAPAADVDEAYDRYLHYFQPFWWHAQSPNGEILTNGERYANEAGALNSIELLFGDDTTMYWAPDYGEDRHYRLLRYGKTDLQRQSAVRIVSPEDLDAVPFGAVVRSELGTIACRFDATRGVVFGDDRPFPWQALSLPGSLLWAPEAQS